MSSPKYVKYINMRKRNAPITDDRYGFRSKTRAPIIAGTIQNVKKDVTSIATATDEHGDTRNVLINLSITFIFYHSTPRKM